MAKKFAKILGWVLVVAGVLGFFGNPIVGEGPGAIFMMGTAASVVHLVAGLVLIWAAYAGAERSGTTLKVLGVVYLLIAIIGFFSAGTVLGLFDVNGASNWLHLVVAVLMFWGGMSKNTSSVPMGQTL